MLNDAIEDAGQHEASIAGLYGERFKTGLDGTTWHLLRLHQTLSHRLPGNCSNGLLGEAVSEEILPAQPLLRATICRAG